MNTDFWKGKCVLVTGHNGFKGCWLTKWLDYIGAKVIGFSLEPAQDSDIHKLKLSDHYVNVIGNIGEKTELNRLIDAKPEVVIHLAGISNLKDASQSPYNTFLTNVMGTVNLLEVLRDCISVRAVVIVTSDKVYKNSEGNYAYTEDDPLFGTEPYSCSKVAQEQVVRAYFESYFRQKAVNLATARASNAFGVGDYHFDRLIPYLEKCAYQNKAPEIRNMEAVRPWQYVLDLLNGYLTLAEYLYNSPDTLLCHYNFGPVYEELYTVSQMSQMICKSISSSSKKNCYHEANLLYLCSEKSNVELQWRPIINVHKGIEITTKAYQAHFNGDDMNKVYEKEIVDFIRELNRAYK